jgi:threonine/homoserine/homoserine lactone efflux protein
MYTFPEMFAVAFAIGLTGALTPGPTLIATVRSSLKYGWLAGPLIVTGHCLVEFCIFILIIAGVASVAGEYSWLIAGAGGVALILFGLITLAESRKVTLSDTIKTGDSDAAADEKGRENKGSEGLVQPFVAGILTSVSNPYFWIWWVTIGSVMVIDGLQSGIILAGAFLLGHWLADISWYTVVSVTVHRGRTVLSDRSYRAVIALCGGFLVIFGIWFFSAVFIK